MAEEKVILDFTDVKPTLVEQVYYDGQITMARVSEEISIAKVSEIEIKEASNGVRKNKVIISWTTKYGKKNECIYCKKTKDEIVNLLKNNKDIDLHGCYIYNFYIEDSNRKEINMSKDDSLLKIDASFSFWDGWIKFYEGHTELYGSMFWRRIYMVSYQFQRM